MLMEPIITKKLITYKSLYPKGNENLESLLSEIPSASAIEYAAYLLVRKKTLKIDEDDHSLFYPMFHLMDKSLVLDLCSYISSCNSSEYEYIDKVALHILIDNILENHNDSQEKITNSKIIFSKFIKAYLICCDRHVSLTENSLSRISTEEELFQVYLCESLKYNDIIFEKDYRFEMLKLCYFLLFLEGNSQYLNWLSIFLKERKLTRWDYYPYFLVSHYCSAMVNESGATCSFELQNNTYYAFHLINTMVVDYKDYKSSEDFVGIRYKPIYNKKKMEYVIMSLNFFIDKFFQSFLFDFAKVLSEHYEITKIKGYSQLKKFVGEEFIEKHFFYNIMERSFSTYKLFSGEKLKSLLKDGEPDYYMRKGNKIFLFEFKDILIDSKTKHSGDYTRIEQELYEQFVLSTIDKSSGKLKKHRQRKGVTQLLYTIENKLPKILAEPDKTDSINGYIIYPIIVYTDRNLSIEGINYILSKAFNKYKSCFNISDEYQLRPLTMISLEEITLLEDYFIQRQLILEDLLESYFKQDNKVPFCKLMVRAAVTKGYNGKMPSRFQNLLDKMKELDRNIKI